MDLPQLRDFIIAHFNDSELRDLCLDLDVDYDSLPGEGKAAKARELVTYCQRHDRLAVLETTCLRLRSDVSHALEPKGQPSPSSPPNPSGGATINAQTVNGAGAVADRDSNMPGSAGSVGSGSAPSPPDQLTGEQLPATGIVKSRWQLFREWLVKALRDPLWQGIGAIIAILALVVAVLSLRPAGIVAPPAATTTPALTPTGTPAKTLSPTPVPTPTAVVKAFTIIRGVEQSVATPKENISVKAGESIRIRAEVLTNVDRNELLFTWRTCQRGDEIVVWGKGVFEIPYEAPRATASDCIRVRIEKGGALLDDSYIWANVHE